MILPVVQTTTDDYAVHGTRLDKTEGGYAQVKYELVNTGANSMKWKVDGSNDDATWTNVQAEATVAAAGTGSYQKSPPVYRYYRAQVKSTTAGQATQAELVTYRHDYTETGTFFGVAIDDITIELAEQMIDQLCNDHFAPKSGTVYCDGDGRRRLYLTENTALKLLTLASLTIRDQASNTDYTPTIATEIVVDQDGRFLWLHPLATTVSSFIRGKKNVTLIGTWGWDTVPGAITWAARRLAAQLKDSGTLSSSTGTYVMEKIGDYTYQSGTTAATTAASSGDQAVDRILTQYRNALGVGLGFGATGVPYEEVTSPFPNARREPGW